MNGRKLIYVSVLSAIVMAGCFSRRPDRTAFSAPEEQVVIPGLEIPECDDSEDIVAHIGYTASYNHRTLVPDWVAYELTADEVDGTYKAVTSVKATSAGLKTLSIPAPTSKPTRFVRIGVSDAQVPTDTEL